MLDTYRDFLTATLVNMGHDLFSKPRSLFAFAVIRCKCRSQVSLSEITIPRSFSSCRAVASMRRTEALASVKFYQILSIFIFFIRLIILEDFIRLISYNGPCVRLGCSFFLATALSCIRSKLSIKRTNKTGPSRLL